MSLVTALIAASAGTGLYFGLSSAYQSWHQGQLESKFKVLRHLAEKAALDGGPSHLLHLIDDTTVGHAGLKIWLIGPVIEMNSQLTNTVRLLRMDSMDALVIDGKNYLASRRRLPEAAAIGFDEAVVAIDTSSNYELAVKFTMIFLGIAGTMLATLITLTRISVRRALNPLDNLSKEAAAIYPRQPGNRLSTIGLAPELAHLATAFNDLLDRLEGSYRQVESFSADVAHELRTPLSNLISSTQLALMNPRSNERINAILASNLEELEGLRILVNDMLFLARADQGLLNVEMEKVDLGAETCRILDSFDGWRLERELCIFTVGGASAFASRNLIRQAISNLLSNAVKHTTHGGTIRILLEECNSSATVTVVNQGAAIEDTVLERMFERFFRAPEDMGNPGHGLGLAIVRAIAKIHGGGVIAFNEQGGPAIGFRIPTNGKKA